MIVPFFGGTAARAKAILFEVLLCLPMALGCQLIEAETSVRRRFLGSS